MQEHFEIIVRTTPENTSRPVRFEELHSMVDSIMSIMLLWNTNSYFLDLINATFVVNGGRKIRIEGWTGCSLVYRRRTSMSVTVDGGKSEREVSWVIGLQKAESEEKILLVVSENGINWQWANAL